MASTSVHLIQHGEHVDSNPVGAEGGVAIDSVANPLRTSQRVRETTLAVGFITAKSARVSTAEASDELSRLSHSTFTFEAKESYHILGAIVPLTMAGVWGVVGMASSTAWESLWMMLLALMVNYIAVAVWVRSHDGMDNICRSWPRSDASRSLTLRHWLHGGFKSYLIVHVLISACLLMNVCILEGNALCSPYTELRFLDDERTSIQLWSCDWELWTRNYTQNELDDYLGYGYDNQWVSMYPELVELNVRDNTSYTWVPTLSESRPNVLGYVHQYYIFIQGQNAANIFLALSVVLVLSAWDISATDVEAMIAQERQRLDEEFPAAFEKWREMEAVAKMAGQAVIHKSYRTGLIVGASIAGTPALYTLSWTRPWTASFVISLCASTVAFALSFFLFHTLVFAKALAVLTRLNARVVLLGKLVGG